MADRSVVVRLRADISQYQAGMKRAKDSTTEFGREVSGRGKTAKADVEAVGRTALVAGGLMAVGFGKAIQVGMAFEKQMSGVKAVSGATAEEMDKLSDAALAAGASTELAGVTASDAAAAEAELVKAGVAVSDVLGGALMGSLTLAAAGQIDFANAATIAAQAMNIFDLSGRDVTHIADVLAAAANKSASDVGGLGDALRQGGLVAAQTGLSLEETVAALAAFGDNALIGSDAGTSLKTMLQRLTPISKESAALMEDIGFSAYDATGQFVGLEGLAFELTSSLAGMTDEQRNLTLATLFGSDAVRGANVLYEEGAAGMREYVEAVNDQGAAARMAAIQNDNLAGDVEALGGAFESALIENGSKATDVLRFLTQGATDMVTGFSQMPDLLQTSAMGIGGIATAGTLALGVLGTLGPKITTAKTSLEGMGGSAAFLAGNLGKIGSALGVAGAAFGVFAIWEAQMASARSEAEKWMATWRPDAMDSASGGLDAFRQKLSDVNFEWANMVDELSETEGAFGGKIIDAEAIAQYGVAVSELEGISDEMARIIDVSDDVAAALGITGDAAFEFILSQQAAGVDVLAEDYNTFRTSMIDAAGTLPAVGQELDGVTAKMGESEEATKEAEAAFKDLMDAYRGAVDPLFGVLSALEKNRDAQDELTNAYERNADGADDNNVSARDLADIQREVASTALDVMSASQELAHAIDTGTVSVEEAHMMLGEWVDKGLITKETAWQLAGQFGHAADEADRLAGDYVVTVSESGMDDTFIRLERLARQLNALGDVHISVGGGGGIPLAAGGRVPQYLAAGGMTMGPVGTDTVPVWATPGEYVVNAGAARQVGYGYLDALNSGSLSPSSGFGSTAYDHSRHTTFQVQPTIVESSSPRATAADVIFEARVLAASMGGG